MRKARECTSVQYKNNERKKRCRVEVCINKVNGQGNGG